VGKGKLQELEKRTASKKGGRICCGGPLNSLLDSMEQKKEKEEAGLGGPGHPLPSGKRLGLRVLGRGQGTLKDSSTKGVNKSKIKEYKSPTRIAEKFGRRGKRSSFLIGRGSTPQGANAIRRKLTFNNKKRRISSKRPPSFLGGGGRGVQGEEFSIRKKKGIF